MSDRPDRDECDTCGHERWNHGEDESKCGFGNDCDCIAFIDEERDAGLAYWVALLNDDPLAPLRGRDPALRWTP